MITILWLLIKACVCVCWYVGTQVCVQGKLEQGHRCLTAGQSHYPSLVLEASSDPCQPRMSLRGCLWEGGISLIGGGCCDTRRLIKVSYRVYQRFGLYLKAVMWNLWVTMHLSTSPLIFPGLLTTADILQKISHSICWILHTPAHITVPCKHSISQQDHLASEGPWKHIQPEESKWKVSTVQFSMTFTPGSVWCRLPLSAKPSPEKM